MRNRIAILLLAFVTCVHVASAQKQQWVDSVFQTLNEEEKIAQLLIVPVASGWERGKINDVERLIKKTSPGGLLFSGGTPKKQISLINSFRTDSKTPILVTANISSGFGELLDSALQFPVPLALGAIANDSMIFELGREVGRQMKLLGADMNLAPNGNIAGNASLPVSETFGQNPEHVSRRVTAFMRGLQAERVLSCTKFFPIQGITISAVDKEPSIRIFLDSAQVAPFKSLFKNGVAAVIPETRDLPIFYASKAVARKNKYSGKMMSSLFARQSIQNDLNFDGLVIVDARKLYGGNLKNGEAELSAFETGNEAIITEYPEASIRRIKRLLKKEKPLKMQLDAAVRKILALKYDAGLQRKTKLQRENIIANLNTVEARLLQKRLFRSSITVSRNRQNAIPVLSLENKRFATIVVGDTSDFNPFHHLVSKYVDNKKVSVRKEDDLKRIQSLLPEADVLIVAFSPNASAELVSKSIGLLATKKTEQQVIAADFGSEPFRDHANELETIIHAYSNNIETLEAVPQIIFGGLRATGTLPIDIGEIMAGTSISTITLKRFQYTIPEDAGLSSRTLRKIGWIAQEAISIGATPGCHVLIAKDGKVVYEQSFGHLTYEKQTPVTDSTIYDLASVTKVSATLQAVMFMYDRGLIDINKKASVYLPELKNSNKENFTLKDILTHQAGLWPFLPFWAQTVKDSVHLPEFYAKTPSPDYPFFVSDNLFASKAMKDSLWQWIIKAKIREKPARTPYDYRYSDMGFYILQHLAEKILNQPIEDFLAQNFYEPLGANTTGYLPLLKFPIRRLAPTENDKLFRRSLLIGAVHDQGAAMHGGIAGHAGLFSSANDLAKLGQMLLQEGYYGGYQYYRPETVRLFAKKQYETSMRGLGWHKPVQSDWNSPTSLFASPKTFGHTGFTGTCIWMDPEFNLLYIFLSNRVHPDMNNNKLLTGNIRSRIQDVIYQAMFDFCGGEPAQNEAPLTFEANQSLHNK